MGIRQKVEMSCNQDVRGRPPEIQSSAVIYRSLPDSIPRREPSPSTLSHVQALIDGNGPVKLSGKIEVYTEDDHMTTSTISFQAPRLIGLHQTGALVASERPVSLLAIVEALRKDCEIAIATRPYEQKLELEAIEKHFYPEGRDVAHLKKSTRRRPPTIAERSRNLSLYMTSISIQKWKQVRKHCEDLECFIRNIESYYTFSPVEKDLCKSIALADGDNRAWTCSSVLLEVLEMMHRCVDLGPERIDSIHSHWTHIGTKFLTVLTAPKSEDTSMEGQWPPWEDVRDYYVVQSKASLPAKNDIASDGI